MTDDPFDYTYPVLSFPGCHQAGEGPEIDYKLYQCVDYIKVAELIDMLLDPYCADNEYVKNDKPEEWKALYYKLEDLISRGLMSEGLKAFNYSPKKTNNQKVDFWTIKLVPSCIKDWLDKNGIFKLIESEGISISEKFKELIKSQTFNQELPLQKTEVSDGDLLPEKELIKNHTSNKKLPPHKSDSAMPKLAEYTFKINEPGNTCEITYKGECQSIKLSVGLSQIRELLMKPNEQIETEYLINKSDSSKNENNIFSEKGSDSEKEQSTPLAKENVDDISDPQTIKAVKKEIKKITEKIEELKLKKDPSDEDKIDELTQKVKQCEKYLSESLNPKTGLSKFKTKKGTCAKAVRQSISNAFKRIKDVNPDLYKHLKTNIVLGNNCQYKPPCNENPDWIFE